MKPIFALDITESKDDPITFADRFSIRKTSEHLEKRLDENVESLNETVTASKLPPLLTIIQYVCLLVGFMIVAPMLTTGVKQAIKNAPILCLVGTSALVVGALLFAMSMIKSKKVLKEENAEEKAQTVESTVNAVFAELDVPSNAEDIDLLVFTYKMKNGEIKPVAPGLSPSPYINVQVKAYRDDDTLYLADVGNVYAFPLSSITAFKTVKKRCIVPEWHKSEKHNKGIYKEYKIATNNYGYTVKGYHVLEISKAGETYGLYFPAYERHVVEKITNLTAEEAAE